MSYRSRVYRQRNAHTHDEAVKEPFFAKQNDNNKPEHPAFFQAKLTVNEPDDKYEKEADSVANAVVNQPAKMPSVQQKEVLPEKEKKEIHKKDIPVSEEEKKKKVTPVQTRQEGNAHTASPRVSSDIERSSGKGNPLPQKTLQEMNASFGADFSEVNVHDDPEAINMNKELNAQAFTHCRDIYFNEGKYNPENAKGKFLLAHELTHVVQQGAATPGQKTISGSQSNNIGHQPSPSALNRQGLLTTAQEQSAIAFNNGRFDFRSRMIIQIITGATVDGVIGTNTVEAIAAFQNTNGLVADGKVNEDTLNVMVADRNTAGSQEHAIQLVVDFFNLDVSKTLSITFDPAIFLSNTTFEPGGLRVIRIGTLAFFSARLLRIFIETQLNLPAPVVPAAGPRPNHLSTAKEQAATAFNRIKFTDIRSVLAIQGKVGSSPDGQFGPDTAERIAEFQQNNALGVDGKIGEQTLRVMVTQLNVTGGQNTAIRLIIDFFNLNEHNALLDISFDPTLTTSNATTGGDIPGPSIVKIGTPAFAQGFEGLVHTIAHELDHVRQRKEGILIQDEREFLGEEVEILSIGMPEESIGGFFSDARRALVHWNQLSAADQRRLFNRFTRVRNKVRQRFSAATAAEQLTHQPTLNGYNAVVKP